MKYKINGEEDIETIPVNLLHCALFSDIEVYFNNKIVESTNYLYAYKGLMMCLLNYNGDTDNSFLDCLGYGIDKAETEWRTEVCGPLFLDTFLQSRLILPHTYQLIIAFYLIFSLRWF